VPESSPPPLVPSRARALYLTAHRAHFGSADPEAALRAWDRFLRAAPRDPFAPEARYNRAILLVKLGRLPEAVEALATFACAAPGSYRHREATALIARARAAQPQLAAPTCGNETP
jgi:tetratricopeptide (TPR) repeat protein